MPFIPGKRRAHAQRSRMGTLPRPWRSSVGNSAAGLSSGGQARCRNGRVDAVPQRHPEGEQLKDNAPVCRIKPSKCAVITAENHVRLLSSLTGNTMGHTCFQRHPDISPALLQTALNELPEVKGVKKITRNRCMYLI